MSRKVFVTGVGMIPFAKPGASAPYDQMGALAARQALGDAGIGYDDVEQAYAGYVYGDSTSGQKALYQVGMTGIPVINVNNNCSTGSTALSGAPSDRRRRGRLRAGARFRANEPRRAGSVFSDRPARSTLRRRHRPAGQHARSLALLLRRHDCLWKNTAPAGAFARSAPRPAAMR
jgi:hypothetical protein